MTNLSHPIPFVREAAPMIRRCWEMGWNEANGGNLSWRLPKEEAEAVIDGLFPGRKPSGLAPLPKPQPTLDGEVFLVTGTGQYFRHATETPDRVMGIVRIVDGGNAYEILWGFEGGGRPTSEFATHLQGHATRMKVSGGEERVVLHCHLPEFIALSFLMPLDSRELTRALWEKMPECIVIFPDGVRVVPPMLPGTVEIADASAKELERGRIISWTHHGIFASEKTLDSVFGLVETIEKAAAIHRKVMSAGGGLRRIDDRLLIELVDAFKLKPNPEFLGR